MKKEDLVQFVTEQTGAYKKDAKIAVDAVLEGIKMGILQDGEVILNGLGQFIVKKRKAKEARNPLTGETVWVPERKGLSFKTSKVLKKTIKDS